MGVTWHLRKISIDYLKKIYSAYTYYIRLAKKKHVFWNFRQNQYNNVIIYFSFNNHNDKEPIKVEGIKIALQHFKTEGYKAIAVLPAMR